MKNLIQSIINLINHLKSENIISKYDACELENKSFYEIVLWLKDLFKEHYPNTKLKRMYRSIHYANKFENEELKQSTYILDEIEQYLTLNKFLDHDSGVEFYNEKITSNGFVITPNSLVETMIESLMLSKNLEVK